MNGRRGEIAKRIVDVAVAGVVVLVALPLLAAISILIRLRMGSPVLFRQERTGFRGRTFTLHKFRTMLDTRDAQGTLLADENRITRLGRLLRSTGLDELPTFFDVLRGTMSLVGPRPLLPQYLDRYSPTQARRH